MARRVRRSVSCRGVAEGKRSPAERLAQVLETAADGLVRVDIGAMAVDSPAADRLLDVAAEPPLGRPGLERVLRSLIENDEPRVPVGAQFQGALTSRQPLGTDCHVHPLSL